MLSQITGGAGALASGHPPAQEGSEADGAAAPRTRAGSGGETALSAAVRSRASLGVGDLSLPSSGYKWLCLPCGDLVGSTPWPLPVFLTY